MRAGREYGCLVHAVVILWCGLTVFFVNSLRRSGHAYAAVLGFILIVVSVLLIYRLAGRFGNRRD